jgi:hypothetical protein
MIPGDLKAQDPIPRPSLPFSWDSKAESGFPTGRRAGAAAFEQHLRCAQSNQSRGKDSSSGAQDSTDAGSLDASDSPSSVPSGHAPAQPPIRPTLRSIRTASPQPRTLIGAHVESVTSRAQANTTASEASLVPSATAGGPYWDETLGDTQVLESESLRPPALNAGASSGTEGALGWQGGPLVDPRRLPDAGDPSLPDRNDDFCPPPSSQPILADGFTASPVAGLTQASKAVLGGSDGMPKSKSQSGVHIGSAPNLGEWPSLVGDQVPSGIREAARRAVAQSQILGAPPVLGTTIRTANNNEAFRSLVLDPRTVALAPPNTESVPPSSEHQRNVATPATPVLSGLLATSSGASPVEKALSDSEPDGQPAQQETESTGPNSELLDDESRGGAMALGASSSSSVSDSQSQPKPSGPGLRVANRSPLARGLDAAASNDPARPARDAEKSVPQPMGLEKTSRDALPGGSLGRDTASGSSPYPGADRPLAAPTPAAGVFPGIPQLGSVHDRLGDGVTPSPKTAEVPTSTSLLRESPNSGAVRLVQLDSPGAGGLELRIQEVGETLIIRTQDLAGSLEGQSAEWKELQQRLETSGIVLMPIEAPSSGAAAPVESQIISADPRHTVCYDGGMGSSGRDGSDPRSSSGRARALGESAHRDSSESPDESTNSAEVLPASRQWWA